HEYEYNPNNDTVFTFKYHKVLINDTEYTYDRIVEYDLNGSLVWELNASTFISPEWWCPFYDMHIGGPDITHSNSIFYDADEDVIYYNPRNVNTFYKIDHKTGEVIWGVGEYGDFDLYNANGSRVENLFYHSHSVERVDDDTFILFDNNHHNQSAEAKHESRMVEITICEDTMTANESWSWKGTEEHWSYLWGDADKLANGNRLGVFGAAQRPDSDKGAYLIEVTQNGSIAWQFCFQNSEEYRYGVYRMERFNFAPILQRISRDNFTTEEEVILSWNAWYNYRPKKTIPGYYSLSLNGSLIDSGNFSYDRFWRPSNIAFNLGILEAGFYEFDLEIVDEVGSKTNNTVIVFIITPPVPPITPSIPIAIAGVCLFVSVAGYGIRKRRKSE
ncbi:MAG: aryl-sulfate sulfotransferase, partial [Candidatus Hodarchaeota archaeon]